MSNKQDLTRQALAHTGCDITLDHALAQWWWHPRAQGLRLTTEGHAVFANALDLESWQFLIPQQALTAGTLITLDRRLLCPYYLARGRRDYQLIMFGSREAMMTMLYGDIQRFITSLSG